MASTGADTISLRPLSLRPGGGKNPFAGFAKGAGVGLKLNSLQAPSAPERRKPRGEVITYTRDFLMTFASVCTEATPELKRSAADILLDASDPTRIQQQQLIQRVAADTTDERDWRAHGAFTATAPGEPTPGAPAAAASGAEALKMQRASDVGRTAWHAGANVEGTAATLRTVKGILNKLTPEKFERLLSQFIPLISNYEVLQQTIRLVFEAAVHQPTFVAMYADLCRELDAVLPEFEEPDTGRITSFRKMLANTCQEEYEGAGALRERSAELSLGTAEREESERAAKQRLLGNIRLIAELFKKGLVNDRIMLLILMDLLGGAEGEPSIESIEAVCELLTTAGGALERNEKAKPRLDAAFTTLQRLAGNTRLYPSRVRFLIRDVIELRSQRWVPRREAFTAKKLEDVRAEAAAELGLDVTIPGLDGNALGALGTLSAPLAPKRPEELELFPAFRSDDAGWAAAASQGRSAAPGGRFSAFLGDYVAVQSSAPVAAPTTAGGAPRAPLDITPERRESLAQSLFTDYLSTSNFQEALAAAQELAVPGFMRKLAEIGLLRAYDARAEQEWQSVVDLLLQLVKADQIASEDLEAALRVLGPRLEDDAMDFKFAPGVLGRTIGAGAASGALSLAVLADVAGEVESAEPRREVVAATLRALRDAGETSVKSKVDEAGLKLEELLAHDAEFDGDLPAPAEFLKEQGLEGIL